MSPDRPLSDNEQAAWLCLVCGECQARRGIDAWCAGSHTEGTEHPDTAMVEAVVHPLAALRDPSEEERLREAPQQIIDAHDEERGIAYADDLEAEVLSIARAALAARQGEDER